jgi:hypothetical protein
LAAGAGHVAGGTTAGLLQGQSLDEAFANSFDGIGGSMAFGLGIGVATTVGVSYANGISPWTGKAIQSTTHSKIQFGNNPNQEYHTFRHTDELGLSRTDVKAAIEINMQLQSNFVEIGRPFNQIIIVGEKYIQYTAYKLPNGIINIGRIHGVK